MLEFDHVLFTLCPSPPGREEYGSQAMDFIRHIFSYWSGGKAKKRKRRRYSSEEDGDSSPRIESSDEEPRPRHFRGRRNHKRHRRSALEEIGYASSDENVVGSRPQNCRHRRSSHASSRKIDPTAGGTGDGNLVPVHDEKSGDLLFFVKTSSNMAMSDKQPVSTVQDNAPKIVQAPLVLPSETITATVGEKAAPSANQPAPQVRTQRQWDYWPDGAWECDFSIEEHEETKRLMVHWATVGSCGDTTGSVYADNWKEGFCTRRRCLGIIQCDNPDCRIRIRPQTEEKRIQEVQLQGPCRCGGELFHIECNIRDERWRWRGGVHYRHLGKHDHDAPTHLLHVTKDEKRKFQDIVIKNPKAKPLALIVGAPGFDGPGESVAKISPIYGNAHRVAKDRREIIKPKGPGEGEFLNEFANFLQSNPAFLVHSHFNNGIFVFSFQSEAMRKPLVKAERLSEPVNGIVNDAAHGFWRNRQHLLMVSSSYSEKLKCWVPGMISFTNGATAEHFRQHFLAFFISVAREAEAEGVPVTDERFAGIMDFSEAEHKGFVLGFIDFWTYNWEDPSDRSEAELTEAAERLLKACKWHFEENAKRIGNISWIVRPTMKGTWTARVKELLETDDADLFRRQGDALLELFPFAKPWFGWYLRPAHARMLFASKREMDIAIWESIPETTNAEEAMHWKLYSGCGRDHDFLSGIKALQAFAEYYDLMFEMESTGAPRRHGKPEAQKERKEFTGHTKLPVRRKSGYDKSDSRGYDTSAKLLQANKKQLTLEFSGSSSGTKPPSTTKELKAAILKKKKDAERAELAKIPKQPKQVKGKTSTEQVDIFLRPSYPWMNNSCWLDSSLHLLHVVFTVVGLDDLLSICGPLSQRSGIRATFLNALCERRDFPPKLTNAALSKALATQRDTIRAELRKRRAIMTAQGDATFNTMFGWFHHIVNFERTRDPQQEPQAFRAAAYFEIFHINIHICSGSEATNGRHVEINKRPTHYRFLDLSKKVYAQYKGDFTAYVTWYFSVERDLIARTGCWRIIDNRRLCIGSRNDYPDIVLSIPVLLTVDVLRHHTWDFPASFTPDSRYPEVLYELVGLGLFSEKGEHFRARYLSADKSKVYTYDGAWKDQRVSGIPRLEEDASPATHFYGRDIDLPPGWRVVFAVYHLHGGSHTQEKFFKHRIVDIVQRYSLEFTDVSLNQNVSISLDDRTLERMPDEQRSWLAAPMSENSAEYVTKKPSTPPPQKSPLSQQSPGSSQRRPQPFPDLDDPSTYKQPTPPKEDDTQHPGDEDDDSDNIPDDDNIMRCRCGIEGDMKVVYNPEDGVAIACDRCRRWSHIPCERNGRADCLPKQTPFRCDFCIPPKVTAVPKMTRSAARRPLSDRLRAGKGALAKHGEFWYPVRLIQHLKEEKCWRVKWWRGCKFSTNGIQEGSMSDVPENLIVDSLWRNQDERRKRRLGFWDVAFETPTEDAILEDPTSIPYTPEVDQALGPYEDILRCLMESPSDVDSALVPAKAHLENTDTALTDVSICQNVGSLSFVERAQISNWFEARIAKGDPGQQRKWMTSIPITHALTLFIAYRCARVEPHEQDDLLGIAWEMQMMESCDDNRRVDVDREAILTLEKEMFEYSAESGVAGNWQWGLNAGSHQDGWVPYLNIPEAWRPGDRQSEEEEELETGPNFVKIDPPQPIGPLKSYKGLKPRPKPIVRTKKQ
ncbi:hypothetical protein D9619_012867 [Psilocybe cf. subviscida]|uniref:Zinc finger PHD-type domain-containing protein n=1 Tax=Psilocybe cf. subviscida TaxID=2480587 RepID=A0A8H5F4W3_9AGAR|nr:hypothetical protein D9619_012867 [Psilocybe cf. subviscida]